MTATQSARPTTAPTSERTKRGAAKPKPKYVPGTPRWAQLAAHAVPLVVLPSSIWRLLMTAGAAGVDHSANPGYRSQLSDYLYVLLLSAVCEGLALLTLGLVKPWGADGLAGVGRRRHPRLLPPPRHHARALR
ncbi:hypothetical protein MOV08_00515 [Streptomyces yunnanensis]|uniref:Uncharacterized protein n=1 Tax=Streptomyces yunnanensis TaxID=156453 RepID=A0ABY7ZZA9_9ACTN|nr:hypothetical protein [Streptomyces yunnanensis]WEB37948.1 hypothetical protein MOV08_00515 [Streptomyces yunnanensis]